MTRREIVLAALKARANEWVSADELVAAGSGWRYAARVWELRQAGHRIEERRDPTGRHATGQYRLIVEPEQTLLFGSDVAA